MNNKTVLEDLIHRQLLRKTLPEFETFVKLLLFRTTSFWPLKSLNYPRTTSVAKHSLDRPFSGSPNPTIRLISCSIYASCNLDLASRVGVFPLCYFSLQLLLIWVPNNYSWTSFFYGILLRKLSLHKSQFPCPSGDITDAPYILHFSPEEEGTKRIG